MRIDRAYALLALALLPAVSARAAPLEPAACASLKAEHESLVAAGAKADMARGPEWAKANLAPDRLGRIERLIAVEEQLSFRCGELFTARPIIKEPPKPPADAAGKAAASDATGGLSSIPPPRRKAKGAAKN